MQRGIGEDARMDGMRSHGGLRETLQDQLKFAGIGRDIANGIDAGDIGLAG